MNLTKKALLKKAALEGKVHSDYTVAETLYTLFPFNDQETKSVRRSFAFIQVLEKVTDPDHRHVTLAAYDGEHFYTWCSDTFLNGKMKNAPAMRNVKAIAKDKAETTHLSDLYGKYSGESGCRFWAGKSCSHDIHLLATIDTDPTILDSLIDGYEGHEKRGSKGKRSTQQLLAKYSFKKHVLLQGDKGSGKTYLAHQLVDDNKWEKEFIGGHESMESMDILGHLVQSVEERESKGQGNLFDSSAASVVLMRWKDGPLASAFRKARAGKKVALIFDEMLRVPQRELNILVSALTPNAKREYVLRTQNGVGLSDEGTVIEETIVCPMENLWVIGTTNIGAQYAVDEIDEALADRFRLIRKDSEVDEMKSILNGELITRKFDVTVTKLLLHFFESHEKMRVDGKLHKLCNMRQLVEAIQLAVDEADIPETLHENIMAWVDTDMDGQPKQEQVELLTKTIDKIFT